MEKFFNKLTEKNINVLNNLYNFNGKNINEWNNSPKIIIKNNDRGNFSKKKDK